MSDKIREYLTDKKFDSAETLRTFRYTLLRFQTFVEDGGGHIDQLNEYDV